MGDGSLEFRDGAENLRIAFRIATAGGSPFIQMPELHQQDCSLQSVKPAIEAHFVMGIPTFGPVHAECAKPGRQPVVIRRQGAAIPRPAQIFCREKTESSNDTHRPSLAPFVFCSNRLGGILHHGQPEFQECIHVCTLPVQMDRQYGLRAAGDFRTDAGRIDVKSCGINIDKDRPGSQPGNRSGRGKKCEGRRDDFITGTHIERQQSQQQCIRSRRAGNGVFRTGIFYKSRFQFRNFRTEDIARFAQNLQHRAFQFRLQSRVLQF